MDSGGVRGVSILIILTYMMKVLYQPWQESDMIGGTNMGDLIALMLSRMRMSLDEYVKAYVAITSDIFLALKYNLVDPRRRAEISSMRRKSLTKTS